MSNEQKGTTSSAPVAVGLSALAEGLGQAYNGQPAKAAGLLVAGLGLSTASGLNTWLVRNVFGLKQTRIGPDRINTGLLAVWAVGYVINLVNAWTTARKQHGGRSS